jgi:hypothetical protein
MSLLPSDSYKFRLTKVLCKIISLQEQHSAKKLKLREFYQRFGKVITYVKAEVADGLLRRAVGRLAGNVGNKCNRIREESFKNRIREESFKES